MDILLIAAMAANRVIGRDGETPWHIPEELRFFKETTMGHPLIMGRKTFTSLPGPLPGRMNIILSRDPSFAPPGTVTAASLKEGLDLCRGRTMVFVIGGAQVFREAMPLASGIILSVLDREVAGDTCFPEISPDLFRETAKERHTGTEPYTVITYRRVSSDSGRERADVNTAVSGQSCQGSGCRAMGRTGDGLPDRQNSHMRRCPPTLTLPPIPFFLSNLREKRLQRKKNFPFCHHLRGLPSQLAHRGIHVHPISSRFPFLLAFLIIAFSLFSVSARGEEIFPLSRGQAVYVPAYSHIYIGDREHPFYLTVTLSIRNTDPQTPLTLTSADYFDSNGKLLRRYIETPTAIAPFSSKRIIIKESDKEGGSGASFLVKWSATSPINQPIIESIMIGTKSQQGISFSSRGQVIVEVAK